MGDGFQWTEEAFGGGGLLPYSFFMHYDKGRHDDLIEDHVHDLKSGREELRLVPDNTAFIVSPLIKESPALSALVAAHSNSNDNNKNEYLYVNHDAIPRIFAP